MFLSYTCPTLVSDASFVDQLKLKPAWPSINRKSTLFSCFSCNNAGFSNERRFSCENWPKLQNQFGEESLVKHKPKAAKHQKSTWKLTVRPGPSMSFGTHCHWGIPNTNTKSGQGKFAAEVKRRSQERKGSKEKDGDVLTEITERGKGLPQCYKHQTWQHNDQWTTEPNKSSPNMNQTLSHDNSQLTAQPWTFYIYTQWRLIPASVNAIHKNNKVMRLKSTKRWDSLNKSYYWQQAVLCVCVCKVVYPTSAGHISTVKVLPESIHF